MFNLFDTQGLIQFLYFLPALLLSIAIHEFGHAFVAYKLGDKSQKVRGRLTLSPFAHLDVFGLISIILIGIGWGKPVLIDDTNFKNKSRDNMLVALAGPVFNILLGLLITLILKFCLVIGLETWLVATEIGGILLAIALLTIQFNIIFAVFNLIPLPPFDGSKVLFYFLPKSMKKWMVNLERYSLLIIIIIYVTDLHLYIIQPAYNLISSILEKIIML